MTTRTWKVVGTIAGSPVDEQFDTLDQAEAFRAAFEGFGLDVNVDLYWYDDAGWDVKS